MVEQNRSGAYTQFVYGPHGGKFAIMTGQTLVKAFVPLPGGAQAVYGPSGLLYYGHSDHLGSIRLGSSSSRTLSFDVAYAPFGETYASSGSTDPDFTGQRQDTVSGVYDFPAREYSNEGRWASPDPSGIGSFHLTDPQSINRYVYARNTPLSVVDPTGLDDVEDPPMLDVDGGGGADGGGDGDGGGDPTPPDIGLNPAQVCDSCLVDIPQPVPSSLSVVSFSGIPATVDPTLPFGAYLSVTYQVLNQWFAPLPQPGLIPMETTTMSQPMTSSAESSVSMAVGDIDQNQTPEQFADPTNALGQFTDKPVGIGLPGPGSAVLNQNIYIGAQQVATVKYSVTAGTGTSTIQGSNGTFATTANPGAP